MATTEIYTYLHTLSLHVALPIGGDYHEELAFAWRASQFGPFASNGTGSGRFQDDLFLSYRTGRYSRHQYFAPWPDGADDGGGQQRRGKRSEEHKSELQSLMRTPYAVFCLKKKIRTTTYLT